MDYIHRLHTQTTYIDKCATDSPELMESNEGHLSACWRAEDLGPTAIEFLDVAPDAE